MDMELIIVLIIIFVVGLFVSHCLVANELYNLKHMFKNYEDFYSLEHYTDKVRKLETELKDRQLTYENKLKTDVGCSLETISARVDILGKRVVNVEEGRYYRVGRDSKCKGLLGHFNYAYINYFYSDSGEPNFSSYHANEFASEFMVFDLERATELAKQYNAFIEDTRTGKRTMVNEEEV